MKAPPAIPCRARWEVIPVVGKAIGWVVERNGTEQCRFFFQFRAISYAIAECKVDLERWDILSELFVRTREGRTRRHLTFGTPPRPIKG